MFFQLNFKSFIFISLISSEQHKDCETNGRKNGSKCVQKYILKDLITYDSKSNDFEIDIFLVPNACSCSPTKTNII